MAIGRNDLQKEAIALQSSIKKHANHTASIVTTVHSITFTLFFIVEKVLEFYAYPRLPEGVVKLLLMAIIAAVLYASLFFVVKWVTNKTIDSRQKMFALCGIWHHVHIPHTHMKGEIDYSRSALRCGTTIIDRDLYDFSLAANNYNYYVQNGIVYKSDNDDLTTTWNTIISEISESTESPYDFIEIYRAETNENTKLKITTCPCCGKEYDVSFEITEAEKSRYGIHKFRIDMDSYDLNARCYNRLRAEYCDCGSSIKTGELILFRKQEERDDYMRKYFSHQQKS